MEEGVPRENRLLIAVLHEPADAVLGVAGRMQGLDGDAADAEGLTVGGGACHLLAVLAADDFERLGELCELRGKVGVRRRRLQK